VRETVASQSRCGGLSAIAHGRAHSKFSSRFYDSGIYQNFIPVMPGHSRSKNGVASLAYVPGIHVFLC